MNKTDCAKCINSAPVKNWIFGELLYRCMDPQSPVFQGIVKSKMEEVTKCSLFKEKE